MRAPEFWQQRNHPLALLLAPVGSAIHAAARLRRLLTRPERAPVPVVCVGNLVAGGAGKTPVALALGQLLRGHGLAVHFLSRGHGGRERGPLRVDPRRHTARDVGDEPLLLAELAPTWIARDRRAGARAAATAGAAIVVMDDGFQNPRLAPDLSLLVIDPAQGFGNRRLLPAGPLREPLAAGLGRAHALVLTGGRAGAETAGPAPVSGGLLPVLTARLEPAPGSERLAGRRVLAFAGIGRPEKFFESLAETGAEVVERHAAADHHPWTPDEIMALCEQAVALDALPVTTAKDAARLPPGARGMVEVLQVNLVWRDPQAVEKLLRRVIARARAGAPAEAAN